jgi:hypothetical protein
MPEDDVELIQDGKSYKGKGKIEYRWSRKLGFTFSFHTRENAKGLVGGDAILKEERSSKPGVRVKIDRIRSNEGTSCKGALSNGFGWGDINLIVDELTFYIPNFIIQPVGALTLKYNNWEIFLEPIKKVETVFEKLDEIGGFAFTYMGRISSNGSPFTMDQARFLIRPLRTFLSFVRGAWCDILFLEGIKDGNEVFGNYFNPQPPLTQWTSRALWCSNQDQKNLNDVFNGFMDLFKPANPEAQYVGR